MKHISVLLVDDQLGADPVILAAAFADAPGIDAALNNGVDMTVPRGEQVLVHIRAISGQSEQAGTLVNDTRQVLQAIRVMGQTNDIALILLDMRFDSGVLDPHGRPFGQAGDERFGKKLLAAIRVEHPDLPVVFLSTYGQREIGEEAVPYLSKGEITAHSVSTCLLRNARITTEQRAALLGLQDEVVVAASTACAYLEAFEIAPLPIPVMITGETGTGKDVLARYIHRQSPKARGPFVAVNVNAVPKDLFEAMFFGHMRGAYTGAVEDRPGYFEQADGGTLFLDEIGDLPLDLQVKLLRALETKAIKRIGAKSEIPVDVRLIAATNRATEDGVVDGLRDDLKFRLSGHPIHLRPLRERREDIPALTDLMMAQAQTEYGKSGISLASSAIEALGLAALHGNTRELRQRVFSAVARTGSRSLVTAPLLGLQDDLDKAATSPQTELAHPEEAELVGQRSGGLPASLSQGAEEVVLQAWLRQSRYVAISSAPADLRGLKSHLDAVFAQLNLRLAATALEATQKPVSGEFVITAAAQLLYDDAKLKGNLPARRIASMLGFNQTQKLTDDDLVAAIARAIRDRDVGGSSS